MNIREVTLNWHKDIEFGIQLFFHNQSSTLQELHKHNFYEIFLIISGSAEHYGNGEWKELSRGDLFLIKPGDVHLYKNPSEDFSFYNMVFSIETAEKLFSFYDKSLIEQFLLSTTIPRVQLNPYDTDMFHKRFMADIGIPDIHLRSFENLSILTSLLAQIIYYNKIPVKQYPEWLSTLIGDIDNNNNYLKGIDYLYEQVHKSREHVSRTFKKELGMTPTEFINNRKLHYAANLLKSSNIEIIEIAEMSGFSSLSHFYHLFRAQFDMTPKDYRKRNTLYA